MNLARTLNKNQFYNKPQLYVIMPVTNNWKMNCKEVAVYNSKEFKAPCNSKDKQQSRIRFSRTLDIKKIQ